MATASVCTNRTLFGYLAVVTLIADGAAAATTTRRAGDVPSVLTFGASKSSYALFCSLAVGAAETSGPHAIASAGRCRTNRLTAIFALYIVWASYAHPRGLAVVTFVTRLRAIASTVSGCTTWKSRSAWSVVGTSRARVLAVGAAEAGSRTVTAAGARLARWISTVFATTPICAVSASSAVWQ